MFSWIRLRANTFAGYGYGYGGFPFPSLKVAGTGSVRSHSPLVSAAPLPSSLPARRRALVQPPVVHTGHTTLASRHTQPTVPLTDPTHSGSVRLSTQLALLPPPIPGAPPELSHPPEIQPRAPLHQPASHHPSVVVASSHTRPRQESPRSISITTRGPSVM